MIYSASIGKDGTCQHCGMCKKDDDPSFPLGGKPDPCLGYIPGVIQACCGHGDNKYGKNIFAYAVLSNSPPGSSCMEVSKIKLQGDQAIKFFDLLGIGPNMIKKKRR